MSSRALRKLQRQQQQHLLQHTEASRQEDAASADDAADDDDDDGADEPPSPVHRPKNAFDMLGDGDGDGDGDEEYDSQPDTTTAEAAVDAADADAESSQKKTKKATRKKKKKKKKRAVQRPDTPKESSDDEIDRALREINATDAATASNPAPADDGTALLRFIHTSELLGVDRKKFNPTTEMRGLFGSVALEGEQVRSSGRTGPAQRRRNHHQHQHEPIDLATGLTGRYTVASGGRELGAMAQRPNPLVQGKADWPLAPSGGLSMEFLPGVGDPAKQYKIVHSAAYQETQAQFAAVVESMDPQRLIGLLSLAPYHVATLLQVSEICKHQGDHALSGDLLERALFSFGRSLHSSFPLAMRHGLARLSFAQPANREFYLAVWRYIRNLEMRGTWKTAFEWAKLLAQLDPQSDPYCVTLMIDQLALAGRSQHQLLQMAAAGHAWRHVPNIQISLALAHLREKQPREAREQLAIAIHEFPYILSALASALDISPVPKSLWGKLPATDAEKLYTELYLYRAKALWNTPEASALLVEVADSMPYYSSITSALEPAPELEIHLSEARHVLMLEVPSLIALLPREFTTLPTSSSDPLPPPSSTNDSSSTLREPAATGLRAPAININPLQSLFDVAGAAAGSANLALQRFANWLSSPANNANTNANPDTRTEGEEAFHQLQAELGQDVPPEVLEQLLHLQLQEAANQAQPHRPEPNTAVPPAMAGDWDYYADVHDNESEREISTNDESMSSFEDARPNVPPTPPQYNRHPLAATVEDDLDADSHNDNDDNYNTTNTAPRPWRRTAVLRRANSDDEDEADPQQPQQPQQQQQQRQQQTEQGHSEPTTPADDDDLEADPQRLQRWLLTTGLAGLQNSPDTVAMDLYLRRLTQLRKAQQHWILNVLRQRGPDARTAAAEISRRLESL